MSMFDHLSNTELRDQLVKRGLNVGPVSATTRRIYLKKLMALSSGGDNAARPRSTSFRNSSLGRVSFIDDDAVEEIIQPGDETESILEEDVDLHSFVKPFNCSLSRDFSENEFDDHMESSRIMSPEESMRRFSSPPRRHLGAVGKEKDAYFNTKYILAAFLGALVTFVFANIFVFPFLNLDAVE